MNCCSPRRAHSIRNRCSGMRLAGMFTDVVKAEKKAEETEREGKKKMRDDGKDVKHKTLYWRNKEDLNQTQMHQNILKARDRRNKAVCGLSTDRH